MKTMSISKAPCLHLCVKIAVIVLIVAAASGTLEAKSTTWTHGSVVNDLWSNADNWSNGIPADFDDVYFSAIGGTSTLDLPLLQLNKLNMTGYTGTLDAAGAALQVAGNLTTSGTCDFGGASLVIGGDLVVIGATDADHASIDVAGSISIAGEFDCDPLGDLNVGGDVTGSAGAILTMGSGSLSLGGNGLFSDFSTVTWSEGGLLTSNGGSGVREIIFGASGVSLHDVRVNRSAATDTTKVGSAGNLAFGGNVTISRGTMRLMPADVTFNGSVTVRGGLYYDAYGGTLRFAAGLPGKVDVTAGGTIHIVGAPPDRIRLRQDDVFGGDQWILAHDGTSNITMDGVDVQDGDASSGSPVSATNSADRGNNTNWDFGGPKTTKWIAESLTSANWSDPLNWDLGSPQTGDAVVFDTLEGTSTMDIAGLNLASMNMDRYLGELTMMYPLSVTGDMKTSGTLRLEGNSLTLAGSLTVWGGMYAEGAAIAIGADLNLNGICHWAPGATVDVTGNVESFDGAQLFMTSSLLRLGGDLLLSAPSALTICSIGHLVCAGIAPVQIVSLPPNPGLVFLNNVTVERPASDAVTQFESSGVVVALDGALDVARGVLKLTDAGLAVAGATTIQADGRLEAALGGGTVVFDGPLSIKGTLSYRRPGGRIRFLADSAGVIDATNGGIFEIVGTLASPVEVQQDGTAGGDRWLLIHDGTSTINVDYVEMQDGEAQGTELAAAMNSIDLGNNVNWYFGTVSGDETPPLRLSLEAAPNPFNPTTTLRYALPNAGVVSIRIYDASGRLVRTLALAHHAAGRYQETWDGRNDAGRRVDSGAYFCRLESSGGAVNRKLLLLR